MLKRVIRLTGVLFVVCALALPSSVLAFDLWGSKELDTEKVAVKLVREVQRGGYEIVTTEELKGWLDKGKDMLIVDTMPYEASYKKNHIPGAVQFEFPIEEVTNLDKERQAEFLKVLGDDKDRTLVFYCGFTKCGRSHNGAMWAKKLGYRTVYRHPGGIKAWKEADYPVEKVK
jgi:thiosulfate/3-mercaptopyruvate sulfurtransferase